MARVLYIIAQENFRDEELFVPEDVLRSNGHSVTIASITTDEARGMIKARIKPNIAVRNVNPNNFDALVIAGGSGSPKLADYPEILNIIRKFREQKKTVASICLAGYVLARAGVLRGINATVFPTDFAIAEYRKSGVKYSNEHVVVDGKIVTADGPEAAKKFGEQIVKVLSQEG